MNKPYLIIVDDEAHLANNIKETFLDAKYDDILTVNARTSGEKAVELAREIKNAEDDVAFLLTDMAMPGMKGFQVIEEIKKLFPDVVPAILTGYADKESAIRAINVGEVKAYFEKPWQDPNVHIFPKINRLLRGYFSDTNKDVAFIFKQLQDDFQEFEDLFTSRYLVWQQQGWREQNRQWLDIDEYDMFSRMIGAFEKRFNFFGFAGGLRKTYPDKEAGNRAIIEQIMKKRKYEFEDTDVREHKELLKVSLVAEYSFEDILESDSKIKDILVKHNMAEMDLIDFLFDGPQYEIDIENKVVKEFSVKENIRKCEFPIMKVHNKNSEMEAFFNKIIEQDKDRSFAEVGRLGLLSRYRGNYFGNRINERLHEEMAAVFITKETSDCIICCNPLHYEFFYKAMGFKPIEGVKKEDYYKLNAPSMAYHLDVKNFFDDEKVKAEPKKKQRIRMYAEKLKKIKDHSGKYVSCSCINLQKCLQGGYLEPMDVPLEYHCPLRVQNFLS